MSSTNGSTASENSSFDSDTNEEMTTVLQTKPTNIDGSYKGKAEQKNPDGSSLCETFQNNVTGVCKDQQIYTDDQTKELPLPEPVTSEKDNETVKLDKRGSIRTTVGFIPQTLLLGFICGTFGALISIYLPSYISPATGVCVKEQLGQCLADLMADKEHINKLETRLCSLDTTVGNLKRDLSMFRKETENNYDKLDFNNVLTATQISDLRRVFLSKEYIFLILLVVVSEVILMVVVWVIWQKVMLRGRSSGHHMTEGVANGKASYSGVRAIQGDMRVLSKVTPCQLENRVCVISFHSETVENHGAKVKVVLSQNEATKHFITIQFLVSSHDDILQMPPAKLYLVFVDFNERNVILEDPNKGLGDLRLTTVQAIDKIGADAILIYSGDKGSKSLTSGDLYNSDLSSIRQHSELHRLENKHRMLSVFEGFNKTQADHIVNIAKEVVKILV